MYRAVGLISLVLFIAFAGISCVKKVEENTARIGNVIFIHPDGTGLSGWHTLRIWDKGPDGELNWDKLPNIGLYKSHTRNSLVTSSNAGATMHSYGKKVPYHSYGMNGTEELVALSGAKKSIMIEARDAGMAVGVINSGNIIEPGSGVFLASSTARSKSEEITRKIIESGAEVILSGGEEWMLPKGVEGRFGEGLRTDGINLIDYAKQNGYTVVYDKNELENAAPNANKLLGVFAGDNTFNSKSEEELRERGLDDFNAEAPSVAEMTDAAIQVLSKAGKQFFLVVEEEGTDNFGNANNARGFLKALKRADESIGVAQKYMKKNPNTLLVVASDSEAGGPELVSKPLDEIPEDVITPKRDENGAPLDGSEGTSSKPFYSAKDQFGQNLPFGIVWSTGGDTYGSVVARADGLNSGLIRGTIDNTDIYRVMYATLFGKILE